MSKSKYRNLVLTTVLTTVPPTVPPIMPTPIIKRYYGKKCREDCVSRRIKEEECNELVIKDKIQNSDFNSLDFNSLEFNSLEFDSNVDLNLASNIISQAINSGLVAKTYSGLLKCNINVSDLAKSEDGMLRGFKIATHGGIEQQAKFAEVSVPTPLIAFQVASFVTGQYYQHIITKQLEIINEKLDEILNHLLELDRSDILSMFTTFKSLYALSVYRESDFSLPKSNIQKIDTIRQTYMSKIERIKCDVKYSKLNNLSEAKSWEKLFYRKRITLYMTICYMAEMLYYMYCALLVKMELNREDNSFSEKTIERVNMYYSLMDNNFGLKYSKAYHIIKNTILYNLEFLYEDASLGKKSIKKIKNSLNSEFENIETLFIEGQKKISTNFYYKYENGIPTEKLVGL